MVGAVVEVVGKMFLEEANIYTLEEAKPSAVRMDTCFGSMLRHIRCFNYGMYNVFNVRHGI